MEALRGPSTITFSPRLTSWPATLRLLSAELIKGTGQHRVSNLAPFLKGTSQLPAGLLITVDHFPHGKGHTSFRWDGHIFWMWICLPSVMLLLAPPFSLYSVQYCFWWRNSFHSKRNIAMGSHPWYSVVTPQTLSPRSIWSNRTVECSYSRLSQFGDNILKKMWCCLTTCNMRFEWETTMWCCLFHNQSEYRN